MKQFVICPFSFDKTLLINIRKVNPFFDIKLIDKSEIFNAYFGTFKKGSDLFLIKKHGLTYSRACQYLQYLPFLNENAQDEKSLLLLKYRKDLQDNGFYDRDENFLNIIKNQKVTILGYSSKDEIFNSILKTLNCKVEYKFNECKNSDGVIFTYDDYEDEVHSLMIQICDLVNKGVDLNDIFVYGVDDDYKAMVARYSKLYQLPFNGLDCYDLTKYEFAKKFINLYDQSQNFEESFINLDKDYAGNIQYETYKSAVKKLIDSDLSFEQQYDLIHNALHINDEEIIYEKAVTILDNPTYLKGKHVFVLGFCQGKFPTVKSDNDFLPDDIKDQHYILTSKQNNIIFKQELLDFLKSDNNFHFSFSYKVKGQGKYLSFLTKDMKLSKKDSKIFDHDYSVRAAQIELQQLKDLAYKYKEIKPELKSYQRRIDINYRNFDNNFVPFNPVPNDKDFYHSYSSLDTYIDCPFRYYLDNILGLSDFEGNFSTNLGTAVHAVLQDGLNDFNAQFDELYEKHFTSEVFENKELLLCENIKDDIRLALENSRAQIKQIKNPRVMLEKSVIIKLADHAFLKGFIDKLIIADNKFMAVIDYKTTSKQEFKPNYVAIGRSLQLPTYGLLVSECNEFANYEVGGFYINCVLPPGKAETVEEDDIPSYLKLKGKSLANPEYVSAMESGFTEAKSKYINLEINSDLNGFKKADVMTELERNKFISDTKEIYLQCDRDIRNNKFDVSPMSCSIKANCLYCKYHDVCFVKSEQIRHLCPEGKKHEVE